MDRKEFQNKIDELTERLDKAVSASEENPADAKALEEVIELRKQVEELAPTVQEIKTEQDQKAMKAQISELQDTISQLRKATLPNAELGDDNPDSKALYGPGADSSFYADVRDMVIRPSVAQKAMQRLEDAKAMVEHSDAQGGYLVPTDRFNEWIKFREGGTVIRALSRVITTKSDTIEIPVQTSGLLAGWVAELAEKPMSDMTFGLMEVRVFTAAGMSVVSNQLLADASPSVDRMINAELIQRLRFVEEQAFIAGDGEGQPLGIINTPGVLSVVADAETENNTELAAAILDNILAGIGKVQTALNKPNAIVMHTHTWALLQHAKLETGAYLLGGPNVQGRTATDSLPGGVGPQPVSVLFGLPVYTTPYVPTNLGESEDQTCVIVGDFNESLVIDREGVRLDTSDQVFFTSNRTIFRAEMRVGYTVSRRPDAFCVISGPNLTISED